MSSYDYLQSLIAHVQSHIYLEYYIVQERVIVTQCSYNCPCFIASSFYVLPEQPILKYQIDLESRNTTAMTCNNSRANVT